jgi:hypothetical protein
MCTAGYFLKNAAFFVQNGQAKPGQAALGRPAIAPAPHVGRAERSFSILCVLLIIEMC